MENGCRYHTNCLTCPFGDCVEGKSKTRVFLTSKAKELRARGLSVVEIGKELARSKRQVERYLKVK